MTWLIGGLSLWAIVHLMPSVLPPLRATLVGTLGAKTYKGAFAVLVVAGLAMIIVGWRSTTPQAIYTPPGWGRDAAFFLMFAAVVLFGAAHAPTNIKRFVRHPQLTAVQLWALAHVLSNGDSRSLVLFGGLGIWAAVEVALINRRDGEWIKPERAPLKSEMVGAAIGGVVFLVLIALHPYFAGVSPIPP